MNGIAQVDDKLIFYDEFASKAKAAFAAFKSIYEDKIPYPQYQEPTKDSYWLLIVLTLVMVCSLIVSGSRTINLFGGGFVGIAAFGMLEGGIIAFTFFGTRNNYNDEMLDTVYKWAKYGSGITVFMTIASNIGGSMLNANILLPMWVTIAIDIALAVAAPVLAFIIGHIVAVQTVASIIKTERAKRKWNEAIAVWTDGLNTSWNSQKAKWGVTIEKPPQAMVTAINPVHSVNFTETLRHKPSPKLDKTIQWLRDNPDRLSEESRKLAEIIGVSHTLVNQAQQYLKLELAKSQVGSDD